MNTLTAYKFQLDKGSKKIICPGCGQRRGVRYLNTETNEFFPDVVSRCDREGACGYHYPPKKYLTEIGQGYLPAITKKEVEAVEPTFDLIPTDLIEKSMYGYNYTSFAIWLQSLFGITIANDALTRYFVGRSRNDQGRACIFWQIDKEGNARSGKIMEYNEQTGKRIKKEGLPVNWVHAQKKPSGEYHFKNFNLKQCFFGEHLISEFPDKTIAIVESEKTAMVSSIFIPEMVWIATGAALGGCKWREWSVFNVLKDREVILFPDYGYANKQTQKTCFQEWSERAQIIQERMKCSIKVSRILEDIIPEEQRGNDYDLADMLIKTEKPGGWAMTDIPGYPVIWDLTKHDAIESAEIIKTYSHVITVQPVKT